MTCDTPYIRVFDKLTTLKPVMTHIQNAIINVPERPQKKMELHALRQLLVHLANSIAYGEPKSPDLHLRYVGGISG